LPCDRDRPIRCRTEIETCSQSTTLMALQPDGLISPPRAVLAFRVGIVGHRPNRLPQDKESLDTLRHMLRSILEEVKAEISDYARLSPAIPYANKPFVLRAVSPLAEGSDRIFAEEAIGIGYELLCPMPFARDEFERDFVPPDALEPDSLERFRDLLARAERYGGLTTFELDGDRSEAPKAYALAGRIVLNQSDLLIAVWDGEPPAGGGSTVGTTREALSFQAPVLWIDAFAPRRWQLLRAPGDVKTRDASGRFVPQGPHSADPAAARQLLAETVRRIVDDEIAPPELPSAGPEHAHGHKTAASPELNYFRDRKPRFNFSIAWKLFRDAVGSMRVRWPQLLVANFESQIRDEWPVRGDHEQGSAGVLTSASDLHESDLDDWVNRRLRAHFAWADKRGDLYADAYRSGYVLTYLLAALAVFVALLPRTTDFQGDAQTICVAVELVMLLIILLLFVVSRRRHWHERWMEYRLLAELIRQLRILIPLGGGRPFPRTPTHHGLYGNLTQTWMYWHMRAIARATGIPAAKVTRDYVRDCLNYIDGIVGGPKEGQLKFQKDTERRSEHIAHRLHVASTTLFVLTLVGIATHLLLEPALLPRWLDFEIPESIHRALDHWLVMGSAFLPALGAALAAISNQGEFARLAKRAAAMADYFTGFAQQIAALRSGGAQDVKAPTLSQVIPLASEIAEVMVDEVADWRVVFIDRPPTAG
jgi:hypothetical protein